MTAEDQKEMTGNFLVLEDESGLSREDYQVKMLMRNRIPMFLDCRVRILDGRLFFYYDTEGMQTLEERFGGRPFCRRDMEELLTAIHQALGQAEAYLLDPSGVLLEPGYIFASSEAGGYRFCHMPGRSMTFSRAFRALSEYLLDHLDYSDEESVILGYGIYKTAREEHACMESLLALLTERRAKGNRREESLWEAKEEKESVFPKSARCSGQGLDGIMSQTQEERPKGAGLRPRRTRTDRRTPRFSEKKKKEEKKKSAWKKWIAGGIGVLAAGSIVFYRRGLLGGMSGKGETVIIYAGSQNPDAGFLAGGIRQSFGLAGWVIPAAFAAALVLFFVWRWRKGKRSSREACTEGRPLEAGHRGGSGPEPEPVLSPTVFLPDYPGEERKLIRTDTQEEVCLTGEVFRIGKAPQMTDYCVEEEAVSRLHAKLLREGKEWYIQDMNSTNGTYVNGRRVKASERLLLVQGDELLLADVPFLFL